LKPKLTDEEKEKYRKEFEAEHKIVSDKIEELKTR